MKPHYHIDINRERRLDLETWLSFLKEPSVYWHPFMDFSEILIAADLDWYTDASGAIGFGGIHGGNEYFQGFWPKEFLVNQKPSIEYLELFAVTISVLLWAKQYPNKRICVFVDNLSVRDMINNSSSSCKNCMVLIRLVVLESLYWNVRIFAKHVKTKENFFADALSRAQDSRFWSLAAKYDKSFSKKEKIPEKIWPISQIWMR